MPRGLGRLLGGSGNDVAEVTTGDRFNIGGVSVEAIHADGPVGVGAGAGRMPGPEHAVASVATSTAEAAVAGTLRKRIIAA